MANGIIDCDGNKIMVGDKVRTETGKVITVQGALVIEGGMFNAEACKRLDKHEHAESKDAPVTNLAVDKAKPIVGVNCVVWGM